MQIPQSRHKEKEERRKRKRERNIEWKGGKIASDIVTVIHWIKCKCELYTDEKAIVIIDSECEQCIPMSIVDAFKWELFLFVSSVFSLLLFCSVLFNPFLHTFVVVLAVCTICVSMWN